MKIFILIIVLGVLFYIALIWLGDYKFWKAVRKHPDEAYNFFMNNKCWHIISSGDNGEKPSKNWDGPFYFDHNGTFLKIFGKADEYKSTQKEFVKQVGQKDKNLDFFHHKNRFTKKGFTVDNLPVEIGSTLHACATAAKTSGIPFQKLSEYKEPYCLMQPIRLFDAIPFGANIYFDNFGIVTSISLFQLFPDQKLSLTIARISQTMFTWIFCSNPKILDINKIDKDANLDDYFEAVSGVFSIFKDYKSTVKLRMIDEIGVIISFECNSSVTQNSASQ